MKITVEIDEKMLRQLVLDRLSTMLEVPFKPEDVKIETKSKQNYRSEWESAAFRARLEVER